jgi:serine/threonine protein kinase
MKPVRFRLPYILRNLKPLQTNVLVDDNGVVKLCDFGLVKLHDWEGAHGMTTTSPYAGTPRYKAPELFISNKNRWPEATLEADIYSLGCMMVEVREMLDPCRVRNALTFFGSSSLKGFVLSSDSSQVKTS